MDALHPDVEALLGAARTMVTGRKGQDSIFWRMWECRGVEPGCNCPTIVLLHGSFGSWTHWVRNIGALAAACTVVAVDVPGFGDSCLPPEPRMPPDIGRLLCDGWLELCGAVPSLAGEERPVILGGFSLGAIYAGWMLHHLRRSGDGKHLPDAMLLAGPGGLGRRPGLDFDLRPISRTQTFAQRAEAHRHNLAVLMLAQPASIDDLAVAVQDANVISARFRGPFVDQPASLAEALQGTGIPLLGIWGGNDAFDEDVQVRINALAAVAPQLESMVVADAGHWVIFEGAYAVNHKILDWIKLISPIGGIKIQ